MYLQNKKIKNITKTKKSMHSKSGPMSKFRQCSPYSITPHGTRKAMNLERICDTDGSQILSKSREMGLLSTMIQR